MLQSLNEQIRRCYRRAEHFARLAEAALTEAVRTDHLRYEQNWLRLARSYDLQQRLTLFVNEIRRRKLEGDRAMGHVTAERTAATAVWVELPEPLKVVDDSKLFRNALIVIVDDDDCVREGLSALIESGGRRVATFGSAEDYLASDAKANTACLILDVHLPGMSGPDLHAHLIAEGCCPPTLFVTGRREDHVQRRVIAAGALGYLSKPCDATALFDCLEKAELESVSGPWRGKRSAI